MHGLLALSTLAPLDIVSRLAWLSDPRLSALDLSHVPHLAIATSRSPRGVPKRPLRRSRRDAHRRVASRVSAGQAAGAGGGRQDAGAGRQSLRTWAIRRPAGRISTRPTGSAATAEAINRLRHNYADAIARAKCDDTWPSDKPAPALARLEKLRKRGLDDEQVRGCQQIAALMQEAEQWAARGHFAEAIAANQSGRSRRPRFKRKEPGIMDEVAARLHVGTASGSKPRPTIATG